MAETDAKDGNEFSEEVEDLVKDAENTPLEDIGIADDAPACKNGEDSADSDCGNALKIAQEKEKNAMDKYLKTLAEFENYRQRTAREQLELIETANGKLLAKLSEVKDNFDRAFAEENKNSADNSEKFAAFEKGIKLIQEQFNKALTEFGLETIDPAGKVFDPNLHEALMNQPSETIPEGNVVQVFQKGYKIKNKLLKTAKVIVSSGKP